MLLLFILLILLLPRSRESLWETFTSGPQTGISTISNFKKYNNEDGKSVGVKMDEFDSDLINLSRTYSDQHDLLHAKRCYQFDHTNQEFMKSALRLVLNAKIPVHSKGFVYKQGEANKHTVESAVLQVMKSFQRKIGGVKIKGPVLVIVSQAPFYRNSSCGMMPIQYSVADYLFKPTNRAVEDTGVCDEHGKPYVLTKVICIFPAYEKGGTIAKRTIPQSQRTSAEKKNAYLEKLVIDIMRNREVVKDYCFIECADDPTLLCGCMSNNKNPHSVCLAPRRNAKTKYDRTNGFKSDFWMMYTVNRHNQCIADNKLM